MNCGTMHVELVGFHFGVIAEDLRAEVEAHLLSCGRCLREYLSLKRTVELGEGEARPAPAVKARLRQAIAKELGVRQPHLGGWSWWERPFAFGFAGAAVLFALLAVHLVATGAATPPHGLSDTTQVRAVP